MNSKRILSLLLVLAMALSLAACSNNSNKDNESSQPSEASLETSPDTANDETVVSGDPEASGDSEAEPTETGYTPGTYTGTARGYGGDVTVTIEFEGSKIASVKAEGPEETQGIGSNAIEQLPGRMEEENSVKVDTVAGATITSNAVLEAAQSCVDQARGEEATENSGEADTDNETEQSQEEEASGEGNAAEE